MRHVCLLAVLLSFSASAYDKVVPFNGGTLRCTIDAADVKTSDFIRLEVEVDVAEGVKVVFPKAIRTKQLAMVDHDLRPPKIIDDQHVRASAMYVFEALLPGGQTIPKQIVLIRGDGKKLKVEIPAIPIVVGSRLATAQADILDIETPDRATPWVAMLCFLAALGVIIAWAVLRSRRPVEELTTVAQALKRLAAMRRNGGGDVAEIRGLVQDCLADFFELPSRSASRDELMALCAQAGMDDETVAKIERLLIAVEHCSYAREQHDGAQLLDLCEDVLPDLEPEVAAV